MRDGPIKTEIHGEVYVTLWGMYDPSINVRLDATLGYRQLENNRQPTYVTRALASLPKQNIALRESAYKKVG